MVKIDENQEAIAQIRMAVDNDTKSRAPNDTIEEQEVTSEVSLEQLSKHWRLGSRNGVRQNSVELEQKYSSDHDFHEFDGRLRSFISDNFPSDALCYEDVVYVSIMMHCSALVNY